MKNITWERWGDNTFVIQGTNEFLDVLTSAQCWPNKHGFHAGCYKAALYLLKTLPVDQSKKIILHGQSMGGGIVQPLGWLYQQNGLDVEIHPCGAYPACVEPYQVEREHRTCGNDIVTKLFPWFKYPVKDEHFGPEKKWWKFSIKDHKWSNYYG
jgi:hypothetical protein